MAKSTHMAMGASTCQFRGVAIARYNELSFEDCQLSSGARYKAVVYVESGLITQTYKRLELNPATGLKEYVTYTKT